MRTRIAVVVGVFIVVAVLFVLASPHLFSGSSPYSSQVTRRSLTPEQHQRVDAARELRERKALVERRAELERLPTMTSAQYTELQTVRQAIDRIDIPEAPGRERAEALRQRDVEAALRQRAEFERRQAREANLDRTTVTAAEYRQLTTGMTYDQAFEVVGFHGEELSHNEIAGISTVMVQWANRDGGNMNAMFQNGRLIQKAQFGLR